MYCIVRTYTVHYLCGLHLLYLGTYVHCTYTWHIRTHCTYTLHVHTACTHYTYTLHIHTTRTHNTHTLHIHTACTHCTYTLHLHTAHTHCTYTLYIHTKTDTNPLLCSPWCWLLLVADVVVTRGPLNAKSKVVIPNRGQGIGCDVGSILIVSIWYTDNIQVVYK